jgi:hypothetical protein
MNLLRGSAKQLGHKVVTPAEFKFFCDDTKRAVRRNEVDDLNAAIVIEREEQLAKKDRAACAGSGDGQGLR